MDKTQPIEKGKEDIQVGESVVREIRNKAK